MKSLNFLTLLVAGSMLTACGETVDHNELPPDAEFGLETLDGKGDSFAIRPGSPEADAVVRFANQALTDNATGTAFRDLIDSKLHNTAAKNIAKFRAGTDATFGTPDDKTFADLGELDRVPYVGRTALMQLFELAEAAGYFTRTTVDCADFIDHDRYNNYVIRSYANLLEFENSRCTTLNGNLTLQIQGTDLLPPSARAVRNLKHLRTISGNLHIFGSQHITSAHLEGLEKVGGELLADSQAYPLAIEFPALTEAGSIKLSTIRSATFKTLAQNQRIELNNSDMTGFTALKTAGTLHLNVASSGDWNVAFPALTDLSALNIHVARPAYTQMKANFVGGFDNLKRIGSVGYTEGHFVQLNFPELVEISGAFSTKNATDAYVGMPKLTRVGDLTSYNDLVTTGPHVGPIALKEANTISVSGNIPVRGYNALTTVANYVNVASQVGVEGFEALQTVNSISVGLGNNGKFSGFNQVSFVKSLTINGNQGYINVGPAFENLENVEGNLALINNSRFSQHPTFKKLSSVGASFRIDALRGTHDIAPVLEIIDGPLDINQTPADLTGFASLERIEGSLTLKQTVNTISGMQKLTAIGGNISVPRSLGSIELDNFLNRLTEFSGTIHYN